VALAGLEEERAPNLCGINGHVSLEAAAVGEEFDEAAQDAIVSPRADVLAERFV
jgi:hypothetical protein